MDDIPDEVYNCIIGGGSIHKCAKEWLDIKTLETHVYVIYGAFGGLIVLLVVSMFFACGMLFDLRKQVNDLLRNGGGGGAGNAGGGGGQMKPHDPLSQRGYEAYTGQQQGQGMTRNSSIAAAPPIQGPGYGAPAPNRNSMGQQGQGQRPGSAVGPGAPSRRPTSGYGYDNNAGGYDSGYERDRAAGGVRVLPGGKPPKQDWGQRFDKGLDRADKVQSGFDNFESAANFADSHGISDQVFGGQMGDVPGMDMAGDVSGFAGDAIGGAQFAKGGMGAFKNKGFGKSSSSKLW